MPPTSRDPDGDRLTYTARSSNRNVASVSVAGNTATVTGQAKGSADVTVTARDPDGLTATQTFQVTVSNRGLEPVGRIPDRTVAVDATEAIDVDGYFQDPAGDVLTYSARSDNTDAVTESVAESRVTVRGGAKA